MRTIKTQQDINTLQSVKFLPEAFLEHIDKYLRQLEAALANDEEVFSLEHHGYIVLLEAGDNVRDLGNVGLGREDGGLLGCFPEYVELLDVGGGLQKYKIAVLYDNDYLMTFFTQAGAHDEEVEHWLKDQAERS